jgi:hypothetical protein
LVAVQQEIAHDIRADEARATSDEHAHEAEERVVIDYRY